MKTPDALSAIKPADNHSHGGGMSLPHAPLPFDLLLGAPTTSRELDGTSPVLDQRRSRSEDPSTAHREDRSKEAISRGNGRGLRGQRRQPDEIPAAGDAALDAERTHEDYDDNPTPITVVAWSIPATPTQLQVAESAAPDDLLSLAVDASITTAEAPVVSAGSLPAPGEESGASQLPAAQLSAIGPTAVAAAALMTANDVAHSAEGTEQEVLPDIVANVEAGSKAAADFSTPQADETDLAAATEEGFAVATEPQPSDISSDSVEPFSPDQAAASNTELSPDKTIDSKPAVTAPDAAVPRLESQNQPATPPPGIAAVPTPTERPLPASLIAGEAQGGRSAKPVEIDTGRLLHRVARAFQAAQQRGGEIKLRLNPPELGSLRLELRMEDGALTARMETESPSARTAIVESLPALRDRLAEQGIRIERFDVDLMQQHGQEPGGSDQRAYGERGTDREWEQGSAIPVAKPAPSNPTSPHHPMVDATSGLNVIV